MDTMTAQELIDRLSALPGDTPVYRAFDAWRDDPITEILVEKGGVTLR